MRLARPTLWVIAVGDRDPQVAGAAVGGITHARGYARSRQVRGGIAVDCRHVRANPAAKRNRARAVDRALPVAIARVVARARRVAGMLPELRALQDERGVQPRRVVDNGWIATHEDVGCARATGVHHDTAAGDRRVGCIHARDSAYLGSRVSLSGDVSN